MGTDWETLIMVFLHDPPDKALGVRTHESVTKGYLSVALGRPINDREFENVTKKADRAAAAAERFPFPKGPFVDPEPGGVFTIFHPVSAAETRITCGDIDQDRIKTIIAGIVSGLEDDQQRFLALWRLLPARIEQEMGADWKLLPAESRQPDHTLWHHVDITTALAAANREGGRAAFLSFTIGPVQEFIAAARSLRDLFTGSAILSWLAFQAMRPVLEECGPAALVFPHLRGNFLADRWLAERLAGRDIPDLTAEQDGRPVTGLPNRFLALVPAAMANALGARCEASVRNAWKALAQDVRARFKQDVDRNFPGWDDRWDEQIATVPEVSWVAVPEPELSVDAMVKIAGGTLDSVWPDAAAIRRLATAIPDEGRRPYFKDHAAGRWQAQVETVAKIAESARLVRPVPALPSRDQGSNPEKCTILGSFDQMGPTEREEAKEFWKTVRKRPIDGVRLREHERLCAISLAKRFALPARLDRELSIKRVMRRFPDTATVAAQRWLDYAGIDPDYYRDEYGCWNGQWLYGREGKDSGDWCEQQKEKVEAAFNKLQDAVRDAVKHLGRAPPGYYAILAADGDRMGEWLAGRNAPRVREVVHRTLVDYFEGLPDQDAVAKGLNARRPVGPALHAAISSGLQTFASVLVPEIVERHHGVLIYAGGDDVLALMPVETALACAGGIRSAFSRDEAMGGRASLSAGIAVVHTKEDLRQAIQAAREAEKAAKHGGRNQLGLAVVRRSGEKGECRVPWTMVEGLDALRGSFTGAVSDRWAYHLRAEAGTLDALPREAQRAELRRLLGRGETVDEITATNVLGLYDAFAEWDHGYTSKGKALSTFAILCQAASFLARARDE